MQHLRISKEESLLSEQESLIFLQVGLLFLDLIIVDRLNIRLMRGLQSIFCWTNHLLTGNLGTETGVIDNPAHILNLNPIKKPCDETGDRSTNSAGMKAFANSQVTFICPHCSKEFIKNRGLKTHMNKSKKCKMKINKKELIADKIVNKPPETVKLKPLPYSSAFAISQIDSTYNDIHSETKIQTEQKSSSPLETITKIQKSNIKIDSQEGLLHLPLTRSYLNLFLSRGKIDEAFDQFRQMRSQPASQGAVENMEIYNLLIRGFARKFDFNKVQVLWKDMTMRNLEPDIDTYISSMMALNGPDISRNVLKTVFRQVYAEFEGKGFNIESALRSGHFQYQDRKLFLDSIKSFAGLSPEPYQDASYSISLLDSLPKKSELLESQIEKILRREDLNNLFSRQLETEEKRTLLIPSVVRDQFKVIPPPL